MMKKKIFVLTISAFMFFGVIFSVNAYHEYIYRWEGTDHGGCAHDGPGAIASVTGTLVLTVNETGNLAPYQLFTLEIDVLNFTEVIPDPYYGRMMVGIPGKIGDNDDFTLSPGSHLFKRRESVNAYGSYNPGDTDNVFELMAPGVAGTYTLYGLALAGVNQSSDYADRVANAEMNITFVQDSVTITVVAPEAPPTPEAPGIPGYALPVMVATVAVVSAVLIIKRKRHIK